MSVEIYYRKCLLDKEHEYGIVAPFSDTMYANYWTYWFWFYMGELMKGESSNKKFTVLPFAHTWDDKCKLIKKYKGNDHAQKCAQKVITFIKKHKRQPIN